MNKNQAKVAIIGSMHVGKTAISNRIQYDMFTKDYQATIGAGYYVYNYDNKMELQVWDTAGMERYRTLGPIYYRDSRAAIFVYDLSDNSTGDELEKWVDNFRSVVEEPFYGIVVGNKSDLICDLDKSTTSKMEQWALDQKFDFIITSAKTGENIDKLFEKIANGALDVLKTEKFKTTEIRVSSTQKRCC